MTPGFTFAAPGPTDGVGSLACRPLRLWRTRLHRLAVPRSSLVCVGRRRPRCHRYDDPL